MRKIYFLLFVTIVGFNFSSCKKDAANEVPKTYSITANWKTVSVTREAFLKDKPTGVKYTMPVSDYVDHFMFNTDGTGTMMTNGTVIRKFKYESTSKDIHFSSVFSYDGKNWVSGPSFMFMINSLNDQEMAFTQQDFYFNRPMEDGKEYDKMVWNVNLVKEN